MKTQLLKTALLSTLISVGVSMKSQTWAPIFTPGTATTGTTTLSSSSLDDFSFFDDNKGIVSLGYGFYLTTDGGATWSPEKDVAPYPQFRGVHYSSAQNIFLGGGPSVFKSTNNGATFTVQATTSPALTINEIKVVGTLGIAVDLYCKAAYSNDGGNTWSVISNTLLCGNLSTMSIIDIIDNNTAIIAGSNGNIFKTVNGGAAWSNVITPTVAVSSSNIISVDFISSTVGFINKAGTIFKTSDGGSTWTDITNGFVSSIPSFTLLHSLNGGICALDANTIYVGGKGYIYKSTNSGTSFSIDYTNTVCSTCDFLDIEKSGNSLFASVSNGGSQPKVYKRDVNAVGLNEFNSAFNFSLYPNPANQSIQIQGVDFNEGVRVKISSIEGKIIKDEIINQQNINISELNFGMYFIELTDSKGKTGVTKFIKE